MSGAYKQYKFISDRAGVQKSGIRVPPLSGSGKYPPGRKLHSANSCAFLWWRAYQRSKSVGALNHALLFFKNYMIQKYQYRQDLSVASLCSFLHWFDTCSQKQWLQQQRSVAQLQFQRQSSCFLSRGARGSAFSNPGNYTQVSFLWLHQLMH